MAKMNASPKFLQYDYNFDYKSSDQELWRGCNEENSLLVKILDPVTDLFVKRTNDCSLHPLLNVVTTGASASLLTTLRRVKLHGKLSHLCNTTVGKYAKPDMFFLK